MIAPEDHLRQLFKEAGHAKPPVELAERIMARVAVTPLLRPQPSPPVVGWKAWSGIVIGAALFLLWTATTAPASAPSAGRWDVARTAVQEALVQVSGWAPWLVGFSVCALALVLIDRLLAGGRSSPPLV